MEPLTAIGLASNIISFIDFAVKLISSSQEIYKATSGVSQENIDIHFLVSDLSSHLEKLNQGDRITAPTQRDQQLQNIAEKCAVLADEIKEKLEKLEVGQGRKMRGLRSIGMAIRGAWGKKDLQEKMGKVAEFRAEIQFGILVSFKDDHELASSQHLEQLDRLTQQIKEGRNAFEQSLTAIHTALADMEANIIKNQDLSQAQIIHHQDHSQAQILQHQESSRAQIIQAIDVKQAEDQIKEDRRREEIILQHLNFQSLDHRYEDIQTPHVKTFNWIFDGYKPPNSHSLRFPDWLEGNDKSLFWINGKAGSGKSTLMKYIFDHPRTREKLSMWAAGETLTMASFFLWISGNKDQCSQTGLVRALLRHLLQQHRHLIREVFPDLWKTLDFTLNLRDWSLAYSSKALVNLLGRDLGKVVLFIDGLDEYHGDHGDHLNPNRPEYYTEIIDLLKSLDSLPSANLKICFSSRPLQIFHNNFDQQPSLRLEDLTDKDIRLYATDKLVNDRVVATLREKKDWDPSLIVTLIVNKANNVFQWVVLAVGSLVTGINNFDDFELLKCRLEVIPSDLMQAFQYMLNRIEPHYRVEAFKIFAMADAALFLAEKQQDGHCSDILNGSYEELCMIGLWFGLEPDQYRTTMNGPVITLSDSLLTDIEIVRGIRDIDRKLKTRCAGLLETGRAFSRRFYERDVLLRCRFGNRKVQYLHRSAREFLNLEVTKKVFQTAMPEYDPKIQLLRSAIQRLHIYEVNIRLKDEVCIPPEVFCLVDSGLLLVRSIQDEYKPCPVQLLNLLDSNMQRGYSKRGPSWTVDARNVLHPYESRYSPIMNWDEQSDFSELDWQLNDDFLSLTIIYGLWDYIQIRISQQPQLVRQKRGRPYLDYALACPRSSLINISPKVVEILVAAGADPNEHCPTTYSVAEAVESSSSDNDFGYEPKYSTWTPWKSALQSIMGPAASRTAMQNHNRSTSQWCLDWIQVFRMLMDAKPAPDVSVVTWVHSSEKTYTISETFEAIFGKMYPEETAVLVGRVRELAIEQGHVGV